MEFESQTQQKVYEKVAGWLSQAYGDKVVPDDDGPSFRVATDRGSVRLRVNSWGANEATIAAYTAVVTDVDHKPALLRFLLRKNHFIDFGAFSLASDGDVELQYTLVGSTCDQNELLTAVTEILVMADRYDDEIIAKFGGKRGGDRVEG